LPPEVHKAAMKNRPLHLLLGSMAISAILIYLYIVFLNFTFPNPHPLYSDEYGYVLDLNRFLDTGSLSSALTLDEHCANVGNLSLHGPWHILLYSQPSILLITHEFLSINILFLLSTFSVFILLLRKLWVVFDKGSTSLNSNILFPILSLQTKYGTLIRYSIYYFRSFDPRTTHAQYLPSKKQFFNMKLLSDLKGIYLYRMRK